MSVFLLGMGIVNPLGTAQALSPFGDKAGAASALVGFWQMMTAAIGVWLAATISHEAMFALGVVLTVFSLAAVGLYTLRAESPLGPHEQNPCRDRNCRRRSGARAETSDTPRLSRYLLITRPSSARHMLSVPCPAASASAMAAEK